LIYTDGACSGNPGPGGWAAVLTAGEHVKEISGGEDQTTNNRMELRSVIEALKALKSPSDVILFTDSAYIVNCYEKGWARGWIKRGWTNSEKEPVKNQDLWQELIELAGFPGIQKGRHTVRFSKVAGHAGVPLNERCDQLAVLERDKHKARVRAAQQAALGGAPA
jgi:ribonuclease HI